METKNGKIRTTTDIIFELLEKDVRCRNDDKWLTYQVMRKFTNIYIPFEDFVKIPAFGTIQKIRQKIQNKKKLFPPTDPEVIKKRNLLNDEYKEIFSVKNEDKNFSVKPDDTFFDEE